MKFFCVRRGTAMRKMLLLFCFLALFSFRSHAADYRFLPEPDEEGSLPLHAEEEESLFPGPDVHAGGVSATVMIYMCGSNLESEYGLATSDIFEIQSSGFDKKDNNVVMMLSGSRQWEGFGIDASKTNICEIGEQGNLRILSSEDSRNMADGETMKYFLNYVSENYDSDRYILILWDHGGGPLYGVCWDENHNPDSLSMEELVLALKESPFAERGLDLIGFDACLMGSVEVAWMLSPYADYMVASEDMEPGGGWNYKFLYGLEEDDSPAETGKRIVDCYYDSFPPEEMNNLTMACIDLGRIGLVADAMNDFFGTFSNEAPRISFADLSLARSSAQNFGRDFGVSDSGSYDMVDLETLAEQHAKYSTDKINALKDALQAAVVYNRSNVEGAHGLSVYFPFYNASQFQKTAGSFYDRLGFCPGYTAYIREFTARLLGDLIVSWKNIFTRTESSEQKQLVTAQLTPEQRENLASVQLVILESETFVSSTEQNFAKIYSSPDVTVGEDGLLSAYYDNEYFAIAHSPFLVDYDPSVPLRLLDTGEYIADALASNSSTTEFFYSNDTLGAIEEEEHENPQRFIRLLYSPPDSRGTLTLKRLYTYDDQTDEYTVRSGFRLEDYKYLNLSFLNGTPVRDEAGVLLPFENWERTSVNIVRIDNFEPWELRFQRDQRGNWLYAAFQITDRQNNTRLTDPVLLNEKERGCVKMDSQLIAGDSPIVLIEPFCIYDQADGAALYVKVTNQSDDLWCFSMSVPADAVNGDEDASDELSLERSMVSLRPGESDCLICTFGRLYGVDRLRSIDFDIQIGSMLYVDKTKTVHCALQMDTLMKAVWTTSLFEARRASQMK